MTHLGCHRFINQLQLLCEASQCFFVSHLHQTSNRHLSTVKGWLNLLMHSFSIKFDLHHTRTRTEKGWSLGSAAKTVLGLLHSKRVTEDEAVWRNAAFQTALWFSGHGAQCDSLWLQHRGDHSDVHPCSLLFPLCVYVCVYVLKRDSLIVYTGSATHEVEPIGMCH